MMKLNPNYKDNLKKIENLYISAFPKIERKPFDLILEKCNNGSMEIISIQNDNNNFLGFAIMILHDDMVLLDYFAVAPESRGQNVGSTALKLLFERYKNKRLILEIENTEAEFDNFEEVLTKTQERINQASDQLEKLVGTRTRKIQKRLDDVTKLTQEEATKLLDE